MKYVDSGLKTVKGTLKSTEEKITEFSANKGGICKTVRVREVENGFIVEIREDGYLEDKKGGKDWYCANQTYISTTNPLDDGDETTPNVNEVIKDALKNLTL